MPKKIALINRSIIIIIGLGVLLRLWRLIELFHFTYDEEIIAFVGKRMFVNQHIPLIGGVTPMHIHLAPYFYWLSGVLLFFSRLNPIGWGVVAALLAGMTMILLYYIGKLMFGSRVGLIAVFLYAFSFYQNIFDRHYWGLMFDGVCSLLTLWCLWQIIKGREKFAYLLVVVLAFGIHTDLSMLVLVVLTLLVFFIFRPNISRGTLVKTIGIFLLSFLPLIIFDLRHDFSNSRGIIQYFQEVRVGKLKTVYQSAANVILFPAQTLLRLLYPFGNRDLVVQYSYCPQHILAKTKAVPQILGLSVLFYLAYLAGKAYYRRKQNKAIGKILILLLIGSAYLGIFLYGFMFQSDLFDHYLGTLFPPFLLLVAVGLNRMWDKTKITVIILILAFAISNSSAVFQAKHRFGYYDKKMAVQWAIAQTGSEPFSLDVISSCFRYNGYRYLFFLYGKEPVKSYVDANFSYLYDVQPAQTHPKQLIVIANPDFVETKEYLEEYDRYRQKTVKSQKFGEIEVLLVDNSNLDFVGKF